MGHKKWWGRAADSRAGPIYFSFLYFLSAFFAASISASCFESPSPSAIICRRIYSHREAALMRRTGLATDGVGRRQLQFFLDDLLEFALGIPIAFRFQNLIQMDEHELFHESAGLLEPLVEIDRADHGLIAFAKITSRARPISFRSRGTLKRNRSARCFPPRARVSDSSRRRPEHRELAFGLFWKFLVECFGYDKFQHRIARKFKPFIVRQAPLWIFVEIGTVRQASTMKSLFLNVILFSCPYSSGFIFFCRSFRGVPAPLCFRFSVFLLAFFQDAHLR